MTEPYPEPELVTKAIRKCSSLLEVPKTCVKRYNLQKSRRGNYPYDRFIRFDKIKHTKLFSFFKNLCTCAFYKVNFQGTVETSLVFLLNPQILVFIRLFRINLMNL